MADLIYLDNAATSFPKPDVVHDKMTNFYRTCGVNPGRSGCDMALQAEAMVDGTRRKLSNLFNPSPVAGGKPKDHNRLVFTSNATVPSSEPHPLTPLSEPHPLTPSP